MNAVYTPGPWRVTRLGSELYVEADGPIMVCDMQANECGSRLEAETMQANAKLIAAAPDLLKALKVLVWATKPTEDKEQTLNYARAAIAKAGIEP